MEHGDSPNPAEDESVDKIVDTSPQEPADVQHRDLSEWRGTDLIDQEGEKIGKLQDVYFDIETDEPQFGTVKEGWISPHLTFVPLIGLTIGPSTLQLSVSKAQIKDAPNIALVGGELSADAESALYHHYQLNYTPTETPSGRRLARR